MTAGGSRAARVGTSSRAQAEMGVPTRRAAAGLVWAIAAGVGVQGKQGSAMGTKAVLTTRALALPTTGADWGQQQAF